MGSDIDYYVVDIVGPDQSLTVETSTPDCSDPSTSDTIVDVRSLDETSAYGASDDIATGTNYCSAVTTAPLPAGSYLVVVQSYVEGIVPSYTLTVTPS